VGSFSAACEKTQVSKSLQGLENILCSTPS
jgi:hypothetical protein